MTFSEAEKGAINSKLFLSLSQTKTYFSYFVLHHGSKDLQSHGGKILSAIGNAAHDLDDIDHALSTLSDLHAQKFRVDPGNFCLLSHPIQVSLSTRFPQEFSPVAQAAWDNFISAVSSTLVSKYR